MKYFEEIDAWLTTILVGGEEGEKSEQWLLRVKKEIKDKIWLSYQSGRKTLASRSRYIKMGQQNRENQNGLIRRSRLLPI